MTLVVDASITLAWMIEDERSPETDALLDRVGREGGTAPQIWPLEVLNALAVAERRGRITAEDRRRLTGFVRALPIAIDPETAARAWTETMRLAETHSLTPYDASYLELSLRLGVRLATADRRLAAAARAEGVGV